MACNLSPTSLSHRFCHKDETKGWILIKTSVHGSSKCAGCALDKASFAARSASSFPVISRWLGIQQNVINLPLDDISWHVCKTLFTRGFLLSWLSMACNTDIQSENITKRSTEETFTYFKALSIASTSAVNIYTSALVQLPALWHVRVWVTHTSSILAQASFDKVLSDRPYVEWAMLNYIQVYYPHIVNPTRPR